MSLSSFAYKTLEFPGPYERRPCKTEEAWDWVVLRREFFTIDELQAMKDGKTIVHGDGYEYRKKTQ